jgi:hypothetical protein
MGITDPEPQCIISAATSMNGVVPNAHRSGGRRCLRFLETGGRVIRSGLHHKIIRFAHRQQAVRFQR